MEQLSSTISRSKSIDVGRVASEIHWSTVLKKVEDMRKHGREARGTIVNGSDVGPIRRVRAAHTLSTGSRSRSRTPAFPLVPSKVLQALYDRSTRKAITEIADTDAGVESCFKHAVDDALTTPRYGRSPQPMHWRRQRWSSHYFLCSRYKMDASST